MSGDALAALTALLEQPAETDDVLRTTVALLSQEQTIAWAGIAFLESGDLVLGPSAGVESPTRRVRTPVVFRDEPVGELWVDGEPERALLERVAALVSEHVLVGWDTGGESWEP